MTTAPVIACAVLYLSGLVFAAGWDVVTRTIPNILPLQVAAAASGLLLEAAPQTLLAHAAVALAVLAGGALAFALRLWGAGDAKLMAAAAVLLGAKGLPMLFLVTALAGGILAVLWLLARSLPWRDKFSPQLPYGVAIAFGAIAAFAGSGP